MLLAPRCNAYEADTTNTTPRGWGEGGLVTDTWCIASGQQDIHGPGADTAIAITGAHVMPCVPINYVLSTPINSCMACTQGGQVGRKTTHLQVLAVQVDEDDLAQAEAPFRLTAVESRIKTTLVTMMWMDIESVAAKGSSVTNGRAPHSLCLGAGCQQLQLARMACW